MAASTQFYASTSDDAAILKAFEKIANELNQEPEDCSVYINVMEGYEEQREAALLSSIQSRPVVQYANQEGGASWAGARVNFSSLGLDVAIYRERERGDDRINISYRQDPADPVEVTRALAAVQRQFVPRNHAAAIERALGPEMAEFYRRREEGVSHLEALTLRLVKETQDYRMRLDTEMAEHKQALTISFDEKTKALAANHDERSAALKAQRAGSERATARA